VVWTNFILHIMYLCSRCSSVMCYKSWGQEVAIFFFFDRRDYGSSKVQFFPKFSLVVIHFGRILFL